jgi:hypothetical protein
VQYSPAPPSSLKRFSALCAGRLPSSASPEGGRMAPMDTLLIVIGVLLIAVIGRALLDPWPSAASADKEREHLMEDIARSFF